MMASAKYTEHKGDCMSNTIENRDPVIKAIGIGGYGIHAINYMINKGVKGIEFIAIDTDFETVNLSLAHTKFQVSHARKMKPGKEEYLSGHDITEEDRARMESLMSGSDMVFIAARMDDETAIRSAPILAHIAKGMNILTVAVIDVTISGDAELQRCAAEGIKSLQEGVDALIVLPIIRPMENQGNGVCITDFITTSIDLLCITVADIAGSINDSGMINLDVSDLSLIMANSGNARMGTATASGVDRARTAAEQAIGGLDMTATSGMLVLITSTCSLRLKEVQAMLDYIHSVAPDATIILSSAFCESMEDLMRVTMIATSNQSFAGLDQGQA
jgi:cell division protein FtsZ